MARRWALAVCLVPALAFAQGRVAAAGALALPRTHHTATALPDGRVLVVGGRAADGLSTLTSVEVYEPKKGAWHPGPPMKVGRSHHAATLLADGRVLVTGGTTHQAAEGGYRFVAIPQAEVFDPVKGAWTAVADLAEARNGHTATLLDDGTVLVVGGAREQRTHLASVERFDPKTGAWRTEKPLATPRWLHAAVHLADDSVVVVGGRSNARQGGKGPGVSLAGVERFVPREGAWEAAPAMSEERQRAGIAVLADGETVVAAGGQTATSSTNYAETWTPGAPEWVPLQNHLSTSLSGHTATRLPSGDLLVVGGEPPNAVDTGRVQRWVAVTKQWCLAGQLAAARKLHSATLLPDGSVLVVGGTSSGVPEKTAERWYDAKGKCEEPPGVTLGW
ncbi:MAG: hypothetical protein IT380_29410 [Myxococcales bacterium]|nr:hypothetical protein [Myxococcales bacterium]